MRRVDKFKIYSRGRIANPDSWGDQRFWALGRHYGLKTPLLDWSASPFIAAFFALHEECGGQERSLYALNASLMNRELCRRIGIILLEDSELKRVFEDRFDLQDFGEEDRCVMLGKTILDRYGGDLKPLNEEVERFQGFIEDAHEGYVRLISPKMGDNPRLLSQRGVFTYQSSSNALEKLLEENHGDDEPILIKLKFPSDWRNESLQLLNGMNINYLSVFPDLEGAALYCNDRLEHEAAENVTNLNLNRIWV